MKQGWEIKKLGEVCDFQGGSQPPKEEWIDEPREGYVRMLQIRDFTQSRSFDIEYVKESNRLKYCNEDDVLLGRYGASVGKVLTGLAGAYNVAIMKTMPNKDLLNKSYFKYFLESPSFQVFLQQASTMRAAQAGFSKEDIQDFSLPVPPREEQERIVAELDCLSGVIEKKKQQLKELDALAQSIFYTMFGSPITNEKGWEVKKLGEVCENKKKILRASKECAPDDVINYIDISAVDNINNVINIPTPYIFEEAPSRAQQVVQLGDVIVSMVRPNLKNIAIVNCNNDNLIASSGFCVLRARKEMTISFLFYIVKSDAFTMYLMDRVSGANYPAVRESDITDYISIVPPLALQQEFADKIEAIEKQKELIKQSITQTEELFNSRMDYYFN